MSSRSLFQPQSHWWDQSSLLGPTWVQASFRHLVPTFTNSWLAATYLRLERWDQGGARATATIISKLLCELRLLLLSNFQSGAVMGILAYVCMKMPEIELGIIFIPGLTFSADTVRFLEMGSISQNIRFELILIKKLFDSRQSSVF